ncbi:MAG: HAMP domain-containing methyl-accepting chemotaxis protein, partial [Pseudomonadota bacterium]
GALSGSIRDLNQYVIPQIEQKLAVLEADEQARAALAQLERSSTTAEREAVSATLDAALTRLNTAVASFSAPRRAEIEPMLESLDAAVDLMSRSLEVRDKTNAWRQTQVTDLLTVVDTARGMLAELDVQVADDMSRGADQTLRDVSATLDTLTRRDFARLRGMLELRADFNGVIGTALAVSQTRDSFFATILRGYAGDGLDRFSATLAELSRDPDMARALAPLAETRDRLKLILDGEVTNIGRAQELLAMRRETEETLSALVDAMRTELVARSDDAARDNEAAIESLISGEFARILKSGQIEDALNRLYIQALSGLIQTDLADVEVSVVTLEDIAETIVVFAADESLPPELQTQLNDVVAIGSGPNGVLTAHIGFLTTVLDAAARSSEASASLRNITELAHAGSSTAIDTVLASGAGLTEQATRARRTILIIGAISVGILAVAPLLTWLFILRPMLRVTKVTERLSQGDLSPVTGFNRSGGEIGRLAAALKVFRDGLIERERMRDAETARKAAEVEEERRQEEITRQRKAAEAAEKERRLAAEKARRDEEARREREQQEAAQRERDARAAEQQAVVTTLTEALSKLSCGDLTVHIDEAFSDAYEGIRKNFNSAVVSLAGLTQQVLQSAEIVSESSAGIAATANDMAAQTERNAVQLAETSSAVNDLDQSAKTASETAQEANTIMADAHREANDSKSIMQSAVVTMGEIEDSSRAIGKIVDLIEGIAFQTNLLALNAGVEAARAGDHGRGFSVVATEVRALAQRSSDAAGEINALISATSGRIVEGAAHVDKAGQALEAVSNRIDRVSRQIDMLATGSRDQAATISAISSSVSEIDQTTQRTAAMFQESIAASHTLESQSQTLIDLAGSFEVTPVDRNPNRAIAANSESPLGWAS